jgi:teichuronopeptide biosynthesis TupA-like protein
MGAGFSDRIATRRRLWWEVPPPPRGLGEVVHRVRERRARRSRHDPAEAWRCCRLWPRTVINKWNGREFAARHGCDLPALYWAGSSRRRAPLESLPDSFVIRPVFGASRRGVAVVAQNRELLRDAPTSPAELRRRMPRLKAVRWPARVLIEEYIGPEGGDAALPIEYKCHTFGDEVAAVEVTSRWAAQEAKHRYYTPDWEAVPDSINTSLPLDDRRRDRPLFLARMLELARSIGAELGTYMRIDFFGSARGCVFNEFSSTPFDGKNNTPYCEELFGAAWKRKHPDAT